MVKHGYNYTGYCNSGYDGEVQYQAAKSWAMKHLEPFPVFIKPLCYIPVLYVIYNMYLYIPYSFTITETLAPAARENVSLNGSKAPLFFSPQPLLHERYLSSPTSITQPTLPSPIYTNFNRKKNIVKTFFNRKIRDINPTREKNRRFYRGKNIREILWEGEDFDDCQEYPNDDFLEHYILDKNRGICFIQ